MTPEQVALAQTSFRKVVPIADAAADIFYGRLFELEPGLRRLFPEDMAKQKRKLMQMLAVAVQSLHQPETVIPVARELGARHVGYGVEATHYGTVGAALLHTLEAGLGEDWTPEVAEAWGEAYAMISEVMKAGAAEVWSEPKG
ncbi:globin family protein [uncultured Albimonas sp.]|uniref:globin family protein n=1 Tax=uncultured Albimonas sp. TaxID=1331701 RepID=UPI0030EF5A7D|tara:strand:- start:83 stop:511 length:429 start_codon:yes stop_codon:yes gene_type:complete